MSRCGGGRGSRGPWPPPLTGPAAAGVAARFYLVVLQYVSELNTESLQTLVRELRPKERRLPRRGMKLRLAKDEVRARTHAPGGRVGPVPRPDPAPGARTTSA